jgi:hypothetical protein
LTELDDGFNAVKKKSNPARTSAAPDDLFVVNEDAEKLRRQAIRLRQHAIGNGAITSR